MSFSSCNLSKPILDALGAKGYITPTPIQTKAIPEILAGRDVLASAQTGTGKTAAFCIPVLQRLAAVKSASGVRALVLTPTRELAIQVSENLEQYGKNLTIRSALLYGGVSQVNQVRQLQRGADIIVATPGRLLDLIDQRLLNLKSLEILVLDEADRMLDMGFIPAIKRILQITPTNRQTIFFSATMPGEIQKLVSSILRNPVRIQVESGQPKASISQSVYFVAQDNKRALLRHIIEEQRMQTVLVFTRTKHRADKIARDLNRSGITAESFHGNKSQPARQRTLGNFKKNSTRVLVATDIAARGIDITNLPFVINYELPDSAETYTHRIGRTGRAGTTGIALSLCGPEERNQLKNIRRTSASDLTSIEHPFV